MTSRPALNTPTLALFAIGLGTVGIGTTEFAPTGMLPAIADGLGVSIPSAGQLVTAYAIGVMLSAPSLPRVWRALIRKKHF